MEDDRPPIQYTPRIIGRLRKSASKSKDREGASRHRRQRHTDASSAADTAGLDAQQQHHHHHQSGQDHGPGSQPGSSRAAVEADDGASPLAQELLLPTPLAGLGGLFQPSAGLRAEVQQRADARRRALDEISGMVDEAKRVQQSVAEAKEAEMAQIKRMAAELCARQFRPPSRPMPCGSEQRACIDCYRQHPQDPLQCAEAVRSYVECSRKAQQDFVRSPHQP